MSEIIDILLEVVKYTVPALIVFLTVYYLQKRFNQNQLQLKSLDLKMERSPQTMQMRLQAYERLAMLCERISIPNLVYRLHTANLDVAEFQNILLVAVQQEFEHNVSQQIYVSDKLWQIVLLAKNEVLQMITEASTLVEEKSDSKRLRMKLLQMYAQNARPIQQAQSAIRKETHLLFK